MSFYKIKDKSIICFTKDELITSFEVTKKIELLQEMRSRGISFDDLRNNSQMNQLASIAAQRISDDRDDPEIFASLYVFLDFYNDGGSVCFELQDSFNPHKDKILTLRDLNKFRAGSYSDFIIKSKDGFRQFQLKRYRNDLNTQEVSNFIKEKVKHYGNDLGDTNLLIVLQSSNNNVSGINFHQLHDEIKSLNLKFHGQILISYNENNEEMVINQVYPDLTTTRIPIRYPSTK